MTPEQFKILWTSRYADMPFFPGLFREDFNGRWFRIHSLPESKRYPTSEEEWGVLLKRHNSIITDILSGSADVILVTGEFYLEGYEELNPLSGAESIKNLKFINLELINLYTLFPKEYEPGHVYQPKYTILQWKSNQYDEILRDIATDNLRAFMITVNQECILAPYDGGMDIFLKDSRDRDIYKDKYKDWLSKRPDGL